MVSSNDPNVMAWINEGILGNLPVHCLDAVQVRGINHNKVRPFFSFVL